MAQFPTALPAPNVSGYSFNPAKYTVRSEMESGAARVRLVSKSRNDLVSVVWELTLQEFYAFRAWFESTAGANWGASWFTIGLQMGLDSTGTALTQETARFVGEWKADMLNNLFINVSATLEVR